MKINRVRNRSKHINYTNILTFVSESKEITCIKSYSIELVTRMTQMSYGIGECVLFTLELSLNRYFCQVCT